ncbi:MAG: fumarylacetoacetate hydrolase family protein [Steroidobacteraceae bacterium]|jgi:2-keto-4-pentenoate hydratase/2-oxohepta-3-ene-1,7-dioic acid hydratase in catechol pathway
MQWARIEHSGRSLFGAIDGDALRIHSGDMFRDPVPTGETVALAGAAWLTPCAPGKMLALWNNFRAAAERNGWGVPKEPLYFVKTDNSYNAHARIIPVPRSYDGRVVYEGELGIVIGKTAAAVSAADASGCIFGYTCVNDVTAVELTARDPVFPQWTRAKGFDGFGVFGPCIATGIDPLRLVIRTVVNGRERQNYPADDMIFRPAELVSLISQDMTLHAGDLIACGTSLGAMPMRPGTVIEVAIDGIGVLRNEYR